MPPAKPSRPAPLEGVPPGFRVERDLSVGRHPLLAAFPGLDRLDTARRHEPDEAARERLHHQTLVEVVSQDVWMYVAPRALPKGMRRAWRPVVSPDADCIVVGQEHLRESPELTLFLDIFHELCHIRQRAAGRELWPEDLSYVERPTEVEAYRFVVDEAHRYGVADAILRDYLRVEWIDDDEHRTLLDAVGVARR